ncbi:hypothetical protein KM043_010492 [Ampulex compressa]|nr:hypothetical protein KM043_010492 [Ampulex compressa]
MSPCGIPCAQESASRDRRFSLEVPVNIMCGHFGGRLIGSLRFPMLIHYANALKDIRAGAALHERIQEKNDAIVHATNGGQATTGGLESGGLSVEQAAKEPERAARAEIDDRLYELSEGTH